MVASTYVVEQTTPADAPSHERADFWSELIRSYQGDIGIHYAQPESFDWRTVRQRTPGYQVVHNTSSMFRIVRTAQQIRRSPDPDYRLVVPINGTVRVRRDGEQMGFAPGGGGVLAGTTPLEYTVADANAHVIMTIPHAEIDGRLNASGVVGASLDLSRGLGRVVRDAILALTAERDAIDSRQFDVACDRLTDLLCMVMLGDDRPDVPDHLAEVETAIRGYVRDHAGDPAMSGSTMAHDLGWSLRQVQLVLQRVGTTPRDLIRDERLRLVRQRLRSPAFDHLTIGAVAQLSGFSSLNALGVAFRDRYGMSPREFRHG